MLRHKFLRSIECLGKRSGLLFVLIPCLVVFTLYLVSGRYIQFEIYSNLYKPYNFDDEILDGYLVWNPKCHMLSENPIDEAIRKFVRKTKFESCSTTPLLTTIIRNANASFNLSLNTQAVSEYKKKIQCCWSQITRSEPKNPPTGDWDSKISVGHCEDFEKSVLLPRDIEIVHVSCRNTDKSTKKKKNIIYENIHAIVNPHKVQDRINSSQSIELNSDHENPRKLSVLFLGIDSVSRLNFLRSLPKTEKYLRETGWINLRGYNKMGDNTFPNLMAILTGQNSTTSYAKCNPKKAYGLDQCPFLWHNFQKAGYVTAYGEDATEINTFNYQKVGFVQPPTDFYLRPFFLATTKLLKYKNKFGFNYCTGPELTVDRVFEYAVDFAKTFLGLPYFGFFWTNTVSHNDMNGVSSMDAHFLSMFEKLNKQGTFNDTLIIFLSDHGMRWGDIRNTFIGWYEERLPFIYIRVPDWFNSNAQISQALKINQNRLTSPYDIYETLRDIIVKAGGEANASSGCPMCQSLFQPVAIDRGCEEAGISPHWCTCTTFKTVDGKSNIAQLGAKTFLNYAESVVKEYKNNKGKRLCAKLKLKKIHRVNRILNFNNNFTENIDSEKKYFYLLETSPGGGLFETTVSIDVNGTSKMTEEEVSRINSYAKDSKCLETGNKKYCYCI